MLLINTVGFSPADRPTFFEVGGWVGSVWPSIKPLDWEGSPQKRQLHTVLNIENGVSHRREDLKIYRKPRKLSKSTRLLQGPFRGSNLRATCDSPHGLGRNDTNPLYMNPPCLIRKKHRGFWWSFSSLSKSIELWGLKNPQIVCSLLAVNSMFDSEFFSVPFCFDLWNLDGETVSPLPFPTSRLDPGRTLGIWWHHPRVWGQSFRLK